METPARLSQLVVHIATSTVCHGLAPLSHVVPLLQPLDSLPAWRLPPNPHAAVLPVIVRELGTTRELRSRHGHRLPLRGMRIFLPHMRGLVQPAMLPAIKTEPVAFTVQPEQLQPAALLKPDLAAISALPHQTEVEMQVGWQMCLIGVRPASASVCLRVNCKVK